LAKELIFSINGTEFHTEPAKIERKKLYGWSEIHALDDEGNECTLVSMDESGTVIIPKGGVALGILADNGKWVERSTLKTVKLDGGEATLYPSVYTTVNNLDEKATPEELLDCSITAFYHLGNADAQLKSFIGNDIYKFNYCYRDSYETTRAFILSSEIDGENELFMLVGTQNVFDFIGLEEVAVADEEETEEEDEEDEIDFSMF